MRDEGHRNREEPLTDEAAEAAKIESQVRRLTAVATNLFKRGSYEPAFESLMKAYLLDPTSPYVLACEKTLMPALEMMRRRGSFSTSDMSGSGGQNVQLARLLTEMASKSRIREKEAKKNAPDKNSPLADPAKILQQQRVEALRQRHEQAKKEHELRMWREASDPPKVVGKNDAQPDSADKPGPDSQQPPGGLLSKLKQGKFFT